MTTQRLDLYQVDQRAYEPMVALEKYVHSGNLGEDLIALVKIRASQLNGCAFCLDMHSSEARKAGVAQRKIDVLAGWHEAGTLYSERERAALGLTEQTTLIADGGVSDEVWQRAAEAFTEQDLATLLMAICAINSWNRITVSTHQPLPQNETPE